MGRARRKLAKPEPSQQRPDRLLGHVDIKAGFDLALEIDAPPAHQSMHGEIGAVLDELGDLGGLRRIQMRRAPRSGAIAKPQKPFVVVAMHPVAQGLAVHAAALRGFAPRLAV